MIVSKTVASTKRKNQADYQKNPFIVVTDTYGHLWYAAPSKAHGWWLIQNDDREVVVAFKQDE
ncbi:hypothetical protein OTG61_03020 [Escherichia coli]|uniref:hypothetical protein n=1 Tax=Escherichia coli TaxID=562 RepID=UPI00226483BF|nr:hypothetical protein [Escherichia coli]MCX8457458.1 hypothetical protein [Escherichia coli]